MNPYIKVQNYLEKKLPDFKIISRITEGEDSQTFLIENKSKKLILRINDSSFGFKKDKEAYENFKTDTLLIPKIIKIDSFGGQYICISEYIDGNSYKKLETSDRLKLTDKLFELHLALANTKVTRNSRESSWKQHLLETKDVSLWEKLALTKKFNVSLANDLFFKIESNMHFIEEKEDLVHGDFGYDNVLINKNKNLYLIDWEYSRNGDSLFDIAWLQFWSFEINYLEKYEAFARNHKIDLNNFSERINVYSYYIAITTLEWYSRSGNISGYDWIEEIIVQRYIN